MSKKFVNIIKFLICFKLIIIVLMSNLVLSLKYEFDINYNKLNNEIDFNKYLYLHSLINKIEYDKFYKLDNNLSVPVDKKIMVRSIIKFLVYNSNIKVTLKYLNKECIDGLSNIIDYKNFFLLSLYKIANFSPKHIYSDNNCLDKNNVFLLVEYRFLPEVLFSNPELLDINFFMTPVKYYNGLCFPKLCKEYVSHFLNNTKEDNEKFYKYLEKNGIVDLSIIHSNEYSDNFITKNNNFINIKFEKSKTFIYYSMLYFTIMYLTLMILYSLFSNFLYNYIKNKEYKKFEKEVLSIYGYQDINKKNCKDIKNNNNNNNIYDRSRLIISNYSDIKITIQQNLNQNKKFNLLKNLNNYFSIFTIVYNLFTIKNKYYNSKNLIFLHILKVISLFFITLKEVFSIMLKFPQKDSSGEKIFGNFYFLIIKLSVYFIEVYILVEGILFGIKLFSAIKSDSNYNNLEFELRFNLIIKIFVKIFTRFFSFAFIIVYFYLLIEELGIRLTDNELLLHFIRNNYLCKYCYIDPKNLAYLFVMNYSSRNNPYINQSEFIKNNSYTRYNDFKIFTKDNNYIEEDFYKFNSFRNYSCFTYITICFNLTYSVLTCLLITYIITKLKYRILEYVFLLITFSSYVYLYFYYQIYDSKINAYPNRVTANVILGENLSLFHTHLFFSIYYVGFNIGIIVFYYEDIVCNTYFYTDILKKIYINGMDNNNLNNNTNNHESLNNLKDKKNNFSNYKDNVNISKDDFNLDESKYNNNSIKVNTKKTDSINNYSKNNSNKTLDSILENKENNYINYFDIKESLEIKSKIFFPFKYCFYTMVYFSKLSQRKLNFLLIISIILIILPSISFYILYNVYNYKLSIKINLLIYLIYIYEKKLFQFGVIIIILYYYFSKNEVNLTNDRFKDNKTFPIFERISFNYLVCLESFVTLFFLSFNIDYRIRFINIIFFSISVLLLCSFFSLLITILYEIPVRVFVKNRSRITCEKFEDEDTFNN